MFNRNFGFKQPFLNSIWALSFIRTMKLIYSYVDFLLNVTFKTYSLSHCTYSSFFGILHNFIVFRRQSWILAAILNSLYSQNGTEYYLSCLLDIKCSPLRIPCFRRPSWILAAILNCPRMPDWHQSDFKSE